MSAWERENKLLEDLRKLEEELCVYELQIDLLLQEAKNMSADVRHLRKTLGVGKGEDEETL
jgi:uncharacterized protein (UPF0335 family)